MSKSLQPKYRSRSPGQGICQVSTLRRSTLRGLMVVGFIVEEISNADAKYVKVTGAQNIGQGHRVKVPAKSVHLGEALLAERLRAIFSMDCAIPDTSMVFGIVVDHDRLSIFRYRTTLTNVHCACAVHFRATRFLV